MALNAIIIISWARRGQSLAWRDGQRERQTNRAAHGHRCGAETIILMSLCRQGAFYRARGANTRNVQQQRKKERKSSYLPHMWICGKYCQAPSARKCLLEPLSTSWLSTERQWKLKSPAISSSCTRVSKKRRLPAQVTSRPIQQVFKVDIKEAGVVCQRPIRHYVQKIRMSAGFGALIHLLHMFSASQWEQH